MTQKKEQKIEEIEKREKKRYEWWWKWLKRSRGYKIFCEIANQKELSDGIIPLPTMEKIFDHFNRETKEKFEKEHQVDLQNFFKIYLYWGDVHQNDFDYWWEKKGKHQVTNSKSTIIDIRKDLKTLNKLAQISLHKSAELYMSSLLREKKVGYGLQDLQEMIDLFRGYLSLPDNQQYLYLKINIYSKTTSESISREIAKLRATQIGKLENPSERLRDQLETYLKVYDEKDKNPRKKWKDIIYDLNLSIDDRNKCNDPEKIREYKRFFSKAKSLIHKAEQNEFPVNN